MFEAYRIRPVLEWEGSDESRELKAFSSILEALDALILLRCENPNLDVEPRIFWTLYGVTPEIDGVRTEEAIADRDSRFAALELLEKLIGRFHKVPGEKLTGYFTASPKRPISAESACSNSIKVTLDLNIDLALLRKRKRALIGLRTGSEVSAAQDEAVRGMLEMILSIQDSILKQGLASEDEIFPPMPSLFEAA